MENFIIAKNLNNDACEIMHNSMLGSVFRAVGLAVDNGYSKEKIGQELKNFYNLQKLLKHSYKNILFDVRKFLLKKRCFSIIACLVKLKQG